VTAQFKLRKLKKSPKAQEKHAEATIQGIRSQDLQQTVQNLMKNVQSLIKRTDDLSEPRTETNGKPEKKGGGGLKNFER
jgi:hypothetical protein